MHTSDSDIIIWMSSLLKVSKQLTPKVTHTKTTITKSTPFLIRKHHLDDSEMYSLPHPGKKHYTMIKPELRQTKLIVIKEKSSRAKIQGLLARYSSPYRRPCQLIRLSQSTTTITTIVIRDSSILPTIWTKHHISNKNRGSIVQRVKNKFSSTRNKSSIAIEKLID